MSHDVTCKTKEKRMFHLARNVLRGIQSRALSTSDYYYKTGAMVVIPPGEALGVMDRSGDHRILHGPGRHFLWRSRFLFLPARTAKSDEYLKVFYTDGSVEYIHGPAKVFKDPTRVSHITCNDGERLGINDSMIVHNLATDDRYVVNGPAVYRPKSCDETTHMMVNHIATSQEYLIVEYLDGTRSVVKGPCEVKHDPFKHNSITLHEAHVIKESESILVRPYDDDEDSLSFIIDGPQIYMPGNATDRFEELNHVVARGGEYLVVSYINGDSEIVEGPCKVLKNPLVVQQIEVKKAVHIGPDEVMVVHSNGKQRIISGPTFYIPGDPEENVHRFEWHGEKDPGSRVKVPGGLKFSKLRIVPQQFHYHIPDVRTKDDVLVKIKAVVFYNHKSVEKMLGSTNDPIADMINNVSSDMIKLMSGIVFNEIGSQVGHLNELKSYPNLVNGCKNIGLEVTKIVFEGYVVDEVLQDMQNKAIADRTKLALEAETEKQNNILQNEKLDAELERRAKLRNDKHIDAMNEIELEDIKQRAALESARREALQKMELDSSKYRLLESNGVNIDRYVTGPRNKSDKTVTVLSNVPVVNSIDSV